MKPNKLMRKAMVAGKQRITEDQSKKHKCYACNGTGVYDTTGSPPCGACDGKGYIFNET